MKRWFLALTLFLLAALRAQSQSTTVSGTVTDLGGQTWNNGTVQFTFVPNPNIVGPYTWTGGTLPTNILGTLNGAGAYSLSVPSNTAISPIGTKWTVQVCSQASFPCFTLPNVSIAGATQTLNITPPAISISLTNPPSSPVLAYNDNEINSANIGSFYYQLPIQNFRFCQVVDTNHLCTLWNTFGGGPPPAGFPRLDQVTDQNINKAFNQGGATLAFGGGPGLDLSGETSPMEIPLVAGCTPTINGQLCFDTTGLNYLGFNGTVENFAVFPSTVTSGDLAGFLFSGGKWTLQDLGPPTSGGGSPVTEVITNIQNGDTLCWDSTAVPPTFVNCTPGVPPIVITGTTYTFDGTERGEILFFTNAGTKAISIGQASASGVFDANFFAFVKNDGAGDATITATTSTFFQNGTNALVISQGTGCSIFSDPTGSGTYYTRCSMVPFTAGAGAALTPAAYSIAISATGAGGTVTGSGTTNNVIKWTNGPASIIGDSSILEDGTHAARNNNGYDVNSLGGYLWWATNNTVTGTTANKMACNDGTGKAIICPSASSTTNDPFGVAVPANGATPGISGSTAICIIGFCSIVMDNGATSGHYAQSSSTVDGDLSDVGTTKPTNGQSYWYIYSGNSGAGTQAIVRNLTPSELNASSISGGNGRNIQIQVNGSATTKSIKNFNATTPAPGAGFLAATPATSSSGNTDSIIHKIAISGNTSTVVSAGTISGTGSVCADGSGNLTTSGCSTATVTVASGTSALGTGAISSATCATVVTTAATGALTTDNLAADFNADPSSTTGYSPSASGMLTIIKYITSNNVNFKVCNNTASSITPGAATLQWRVIR